MRIKSDTPSHNAAVSPALPSGLKSSSAFSSFMHPDTAALCEGVSLLMRMLYPACPHITDEVWQQLGYAQAVGELLDAPWPSVDEAALERDQIELMLQINGKLRGAIVVPANADKALIESTAIASEEFQKQAAGAAPKKVIVVPGRLVNLVI